MSKYKRTSKNLKLGWLSQEPDSTIFVKICSELRTGTSEDGSEFLYFEVRELDDESKTLMRYALGVALEDILKDAEIGTNYEIAKHQKEKGKRYFTYSVYVVE